MSYYFSNFCVETKEVQRVRFAPSYNVRGRSVAEPWGPEKAGRTSSYRHRIQYTVIDFYFARFLVMVGLVGQGIEHYISHCRFLKYIYFLRRQRNRRYVASLRVGARQIKSYSANSELICNCRSSGTEVTAVRCKLVHTPPWDIDIE
jgi:hypothetical protein